MGSNSLYASSLNSSLTQAHVKLIADETVHTPNNRRLCDKRRKVVNGSILNECRYV